MNNDGIKNISIYCCIYNTLPLFFKETLESLQSQVGISECELVVFDDGSDDNNSLQYESLLNIFESNCSFIKQIIYKKIPVNMGVGFSAHEAVLLCNYEIIFRMDTDDILSPNRIKLQYQFMQEHPRCMLCTGDIREFKMHNNNIQLLNKTNHPSIITWEMFKNEYKKNKNYWFYNGPLFCFRKSAVIDVGNYNKNLRLGEDGELFVRILKKYGFICNVKVNQALLLYRNHDSNTSRNKEINNQYLLFLHKLIQNHITNDTNKD